jgi:lysozyme family protein
MRANLHIALKLIAGAEGGFSNHPKDPGGATMKGVTLKTYTAYRLARGGTKPSVADLKAISDAEVEDIFIRQYWAPVHGDELPAGLDIVVPDFSFNSGAGQALTELQRVVTALGYDTHGADGKFGEHTRGALRAAMLGVGEDRVINAYQDKRLAFMQSLKTWPTFKNGWTTRVREMRENGLRVAHGDHAFPPSVGAVAKAEPSPPGPRAAHNRFWPIPRMRRRPT